MLRLAIGVVAVFGLLVGTARADDKAKKDNNKNDTTKNDANKKWTEAKITKVDPKKGTVTVHMKDANGKDTDRTFTLAEDIHYWDSTGRAATVDVFQSGNEVLVVEHEGKIHEMKKHDKDHSDHTNKK